MENEPVWMSYAEAKAHKDLMHSREQELLRSWGLGWLIDFCSPSNKENESDISEQGGSDIPG